MDPNIISCTYINKIPSHWHLIHINLSCAKYWWSRDRLAQCKSLTKLNCISNIDPPRTLIKLCLFSNSNSNLSPTIRGLFITISKILLQKQTTQLSGQTTSFGNRNQNPKIPDLLHNTSRPASETSYDINIVIYTQLILTMLGSPSVLTQIWWET